MSVTLDTVRALVKAGDFVISQHGARRLLARAIRLDDVIGGLAAGTLVEDYPDSFAGPTVLVLLSGPKGEAVHALWGMATGTRRPAVLITAYRPDPSEWLPDFRTRRS